MAHVETETPPLPFDRGSCPLDPPPVYEQWREEGPIRRVSLPGERGAWLVTRYDDIRAVLGDSRVSSDSRHPDFPGNRAGQMPLPGSFINTDAPEHDVLRRMLTRTFMVRNIERMRPGIRQVTADLLEQMAAQPQPADLVEHFALPLPSLVICELFGVPYADREVFQKNATVVVSRTASLEVNAANQALFSYMLELLARKDRQPGEDLFSELAAERVRTGQLTREQAAGMGVLLLIAGHETTTNMISLSTIALLREPAQLRRLLDEPASVPLAVEELLRYLSIVHNGLRRIAVEDIEVGGTTVRAGDGIVVPLQSANRDGQIFTDPDRLDLDRGARNHVAFGYGIHQCLGQPLARAELQIALPALFTRFPGLHIAAPTADLPYKDDAAVYGLRGLPVTW
jgi:cytochrome P450